MVVKGKTKKGGKDQPSSQPKVTPSKPLDLDPSRLQLEPDTFCTMPDTMMHQIPVSQVGPLASGVALVTHAEAMPFLHANQVLTTKGLALLIVNGPQELSTDLQWSSIRFAARCAVNQQPVLLHGFLVQLGNATVCPFKRPTSVSVPDVPVTCARITVFQDQWPQDWENVLSTPSQGSSTAHTCTANVSHRGLHLPKVASRSDGPCTRCRPGCLQTSVLHRGRPTHQSQSCQPL